MGRQGVHKASDFVKTRVSIYDNSRIRNIHTSITVSTVTALEDSRRTMNPHRSIHVRKVVKVLPQVGKMIIIQMPARNKKKKAVPPHELHPGNTLY